MLPLEKTKKKLIIWSVVTLMACGLYVFCISLISSINKGLATIDYELDMEIQKENTLKDLSFIIRETESDRAVLDSYSIDSDGVVSFINSIEIYAKELGNNPEITSVSIKQLDPINELFEELELQLIVRGNWSGVYTFTKLLDYLPQNTLITKINLDKKSYTDEEEKKETLWEAVFTINTLKKK